MSAYAKTIVAILGATLTAVLAGFPDNPDVQTWGPIIAAFLTAVGVYATPNTPADS
jgi:hypothetical protein